MARGRRGRARASTEATRPMAAQGTLPTDAAFDTNALWCCTGLCRQRNHVLEGALHRGRCCGSCESISVEVFVDSARGRCSGQFPVHVVFNVDARAPCQGGGSYAGSFRDGVDARSGETAPPARSNCGDHGGRKRRASARKSQRGVANAEPAPCEAARAAAYTVSEWFAARSTGAVSQDRERPTPSTAPIWQ